MTQKQEYKEIIENNGYINLEVVGEFLRKGMIADYELVGELVKNGMSTFDYNALQEALDELEVPHVE